MRLSRSLPRPLRPWLVLAAVPLLLLPGTGRAQSADARSEEGPAQSPAAVGEELLMHFEVSMRKFIALAEAMPAETYTWSPGEGVMEVGHVYMHVARYNYLYLSGNMDAVLPPGVELEGMEAIREKDRVLRELERSRDWVRESVGSMSAGDLARPTRLYGREIERWAVLVQLVAHMNEHLGQSIAYARTNGVVPPWSR